MMGRDDRAYLPRFFLGSSAVLVVLAVLVPGPARAQPADPSQAAAWVEDGLSMGPERLDDAAERYRRALAVYEAAGDTNGLALVHLLLATVADERGDGEEALSHLDRSLEMLDGSANSQDLLAIWLVETLAAELEIQRGSAAQSVERSQHALAMLAQLEDPRIKPDSRLLEAYGRQSYCPNAASWRELLRLPPTQQAMVRRLFRVMNLRAIGLGERALGHAAVAHAAFAEAKEKSGPFDLFSEEIDQALVELARELDQPGPRRQALEFSLQGAVDKGDWRLEYRLRHEVAELACAQGEQADAAEALQQALDLAELVAQEDLAAETRRQLAALQCEGASR